MKDFTKFIDEAFVNSDATDSNDFASMFRGAIADEQSATNLYTKIESLLIEKFGKNHEAVEIINEIKRDEENHTGKLLYLVEKFIDDADKEKLENGMKNEE